MVIITGLMGSGKTQCQELTAELETKEGWNIKDISYIDNSEEPDTNKIIIVWDDCCGRYNTNPALWLEVWDRLLRLLDWVKVKNHKAVVCLRTAEYESLIEGFDSEDDKGKQDLAQIASVRASLDPEDFVSDLKLSVEKNLDGDVKGAILEELKSTSVSKSKFKFELLSLLGIPGIIRLLCIPDIAKNINAFVQDPVDALVKVFEDMRQQNPMLYNTLICVMLRGGKINFEEVDIDFLEFTQVSFLGYKYAAGSELREEYDELACSVPAILRKNIDKTFTFRHKLLFLCLFQHYFISDKNDIHVIVKFCDLDIIMELLRPQDYDSKSYERDLQHLFGRTIIDSWCLEVRSKILCTTLMERINTESAFKSHPLQDCKNESA